MRSPSLDPYTEDGKPSVWPPPTVHTGDGRRLEDLTYTELCSTEPPPRDNWRGYFYRSFRLELDRRSPRAPRWPALWFGPERGWEPIL